MSTLEDNHILRKKNSVFFTIVPLQKVPKIVNLCCPGCGSKFGTKECRTTDISEFRVEYKI